MIRNSTLSMLMLLTAPLLAQEDGRGTEVEQAYSVVEEMPEFPGGKEALVEFLSSNIQYPVEAIDAGVTGTVYINFVVEQDGTVSNAQVVRGIGGGCDDEALRVVMEMPDWKPGLQKGEPVRVQYNLPVRFELPSEKGPAPADPAKG